MKRIDYSKYSLSELYSVKSDIDASRNPENFIALEKELSKRESHFTSNVAPQETKEFDDFSDDPIAKVTSWSATDFNSSSSFCTHHLVDINENRLEFFSSDKSIGFLLVFMLSGVVAVLFGYLMQRSGYELLAIMPFSIGGLFILASVAGLYFGSTPIVFDKELGLFWCGRKKTVVSENYVPSDFLVRLSDIYALQLLDKLVREDDGDYLFYELNFVLKTGSRIHVMSHGDEKELTTDAKKLSLFLEVPIWNGIDKKPRSELGTLAVSLLTENTRQRI
ncbi:hypothetical protein [Aliikangiella coralliicola]|uniref:Uncharacterized protein n=1 Tax=Aliikangiella coralliicola TaxID=2592383 RepID=A0A545TSY1_9GAMM|nr:hypothetical protein [Aliikangiella coralliicola]TQV80251.1 hypothetical protein FLL46_26395 [Aliikangiella coralliicola]